MKEGKSIKDFIQRFIAITNQLMLFGKQFDNADLVHKVLRSLTKEWYLKESLKMGMLTIQELYGNLEEHELELNWYRKNGDENKKKSLTLKASNSFNDEDNELNEINTKGEEDEMVLLSKKLQRILKDNKNKEKRKTLLQKKNLNKNDQGRSFDTSTTSNTQPTCFECKKPDTSNWIAQSTLKSYSKNEKKKESSLPKRQFL